MKRYKYYFKDILVILSMSIFTVGEVCQVSNDSIFYKVLAVLSIILIGIKITRDKYTKVEYIVIGSLLFLSLICFYYSRAVSFIISVLMIIGLKEVNINKILKINFVVRIITFSFMVLLAIFRIVPSKIVEMTRMTGEVITRYSLGFDHPNQLHIHFSIIIILYLYLRFEKICIFDYLIIFTMNLIVYKFSVSRTGMAICIGALFLTYLLRYLYMKNIKLPICIAYSVIICTLLSLISCILFDEGGWYKYINTLFQGRLYNSYLYMKLYPPTVFGNFITRDISNLILDNAYIIIWLRFGWVMLILYNIAYTLLLKKAIKDNQYSVILVTLLFSIYGITEGFLSNVFLNFSLLFLNGILYKTESEYSRKT